MATKKLKPRRFNEGDLVEAADKAAGLKASSGEKVGFFERLRMGNIDDPNSEAYNRFGAGRAKADRDMESEAAAQRVVDSSRAAPKAKADESPVTPIYKDFMSEKEPGWDTKAGSKPSASKPSANTSRTLTKPSASSSSTYRADSGPGKLASRADTQSYTRKMGAAADRTAPATVTDTGSDISRMLARAPAPAKAVPAKAAPVEKKSSYETPYDRMNRQNREAESSRRSAADAERATLRKNIRERNTGRVDPDTLLPESAMKKGGSVKGWGMARGARKAKIV